jgi:hypothetical protein
MGRLVVSEYVTLDGIMDELDLWYGPHWNEEAAKFKHDDVFASDALLLGRSTFEEFVNF